MTSENFDHTRACFAALDRAIAAVAKEEFARLSGGLSQEAIADKVIHALQDLRKLQDPTAEPPDYDDPWVALFYVLWYQPGQTYLAYRVLCQLADFRTSEHLSIVDIGCGALAIEIALDMALVTGQLSGTGIPIDRPVVYSLDTSDTMIRLGERISIALLSDLMQLKLPSNPWSARIVVTSDMCNLGDRKPHENWWLTALHAVYDSNVDAIRTQFSAIDERTTLDQCVMTTHALKKHLLPLASGLRTFQPEPFPDPGIVDIRFFPPTSHILEFRQTVLRIVAAVEGSAERRDGIRLAKRYLPRSPSWFKSLQDTSCLRFGRKPMR